MTLTITVPTWLLWLVGVPVGLVFLFLAFIGFIFLWQWRR